MKLATKAILLLSGMWLAGGAHAVIISTVGALDEILYSTTLPDSSELAEEEWMEAMLGVDIVYDKVTGSAGESWEQVTEDDGTTAIENQWAFDFGAGNEPTHYLLKLGDGNLNGDSHFLMSNSVARQWAHILLTDFPTQNGGPGGEKTIDIFRVSHVATAGAQVPEPGTLGLLGAGLIGLGLMRKRKV